MKLLQRSRTCISCTFFKAILCDVRILYQDASSFQDGDFSWFDQRAQHFLKLELFGISLHWPPSTKPREHQLVCLFVNVDQMSHSEQHKEYIALQFHSQHLTLSLNTFLSSNKCQAFPMVDMPEELGETFTEKWRMRHDLLINEIRSLQSHVTTTAETEQSELIDPLEPQVAEPGVAFEPELVQTVESQVFEPEREVETVESEVVDKVEPPGRPIEPVMEETEEIESASDLGELPSWKRQAKELDRLNARLQSALNLDTCFGPVKSAAKRCKSEVKKQASRLSRSTKKLQDRAHGDQDQDHLGLMTSKSEAALPTRPISTSPGHSKSVVALRPAWDPTTSTKPSPTSNGKEQKNWERKNKKNEQKDQKAMKDVKRDQKAEKETKGLMDMAKRPVPPQHARKHTTRGVPARLQVGSPFDQPRMSVMARLSKVQLDTNMPREEATRTKFTKNHNIPQLCLEGLPTFNSAVVPTTMGSSYVPSCTSSPQLWYRPISPASQGSNVSLTGGGVFRSPGQVLQKSSPQRLAL